MTTLESEQASLEQGPTHPSDAPGDNHDDRLEPPIESEEPDWVPTGEPHMYARASGVPGVPEVRRIVAPTFVLPVRKPGRPNNDVAGYRLLTLDEYDEAEAAETAPVNDGIWLQRFTWGNKAMKLNGTPMQLIDGDESTPEVTMAIVEQDGDRSIEFTFGNDLTLLSFEDDEYSAARPQTAAAGSEEAEGLHGVITAAMPLKKINGQEVMDPAWVIFYRYTEANGEYATIIFGAVEQAMELYADYVEAVPAPADETASISLEEPEALAGLYTGIRRADINCLFTQSQPSAPSDIGLQPGSNAPDSVSVREQINDYVQYMMERPDAAAPTPRDAERQAMLQPAAQRPRVIGNLDKAAAVEAKSIAVQWTALEQAIKPHTRSYISGKARA